MNNNSDSEDDKENQYNNNNSNNSPSKGTTTLRPRTAPPPVSGKLFLTFEQTSKITSIASSFNSTIDITGYGGVCFSLFYPIIHFYIGNIGYKNQPNFSFK